MEKEYLIDDFYIIESLENDDIHDGSLFYQCLQSIKGFNPVFVNANNLEELEHNLIAFEKSKLKHLFISAHGDEENIDLKEESVNSYDLFDINIDLKGRRVFMSTCKGGSYLLAKYFIKQGAYSVVGTPVDLPQLVAAGMWPTLLLLFGKFNDYNVRFSELNDSLKIAAEIYDIPIHYYSFLRKQSNMMKEYIYLKNNKRRRTDFKI